LKDLNIQVSMTGYDDWNRLVSKNETILLVNLSRKSLALKFNLYDSDTLVPVSGASVTIAAENKTQIKQTDAAGSATFGVLAATFYSVEITAPNYQPRSSTVDMRSENKEVQYWLLSGNRFSFVVKDKDGKAPIADAEVRIDSVLAGKTDARGFLTTPVVRGNVYTIEIKKPGYQASTESRMISDTDALYTAELSKSAVGAFIYVFDESRVPLSGADVYINGSVSGTTNEYGRITFPNFVSGAYSVEVRKTGYVTVSRTILVSGMVEDNTFVMPFENADLIITVRDRDQSVVPNATIVINGNAAGVTDARGQFSTRVQFNTPYNITSSKTGYQPASARTQVISGNATSSVTLTMEKSLDWGLITMIAIGAIGVLVLFAAIRMFGHRKRRHVMRRNEI
jgi:hypothetical protein